VLLQLEQQMDKAGKKKGGGAKSIGGETVGAGDVGRETVGGRVRFGRDKCGRAHGEGNWPGGLGPDHSGLGQFKSGWAALFRVGRPV
jgi:hypothetical protein